MKTPVDLSWRPHSLLKQMQRIKLYTTLHNKHNKGRWNNYFGEVCNTIEYFQANSLKFYFYGACFRDTNTQPHIFKTCRFTVSVMEKVWYFPFVSLSPSQVEHDDCSPHNVTLGYYVTSGKIAYISSMVIEALSVYGFDKLLSDIRQHTPLVKAVLVPVTPWLPIPSIHLQIKTGKETW